MIAPRSFVMSRRGEDVSHRGNRQICRANVLGSAKATTDNDSSRSCFGNRINGSFVRERDPEEKIDRFFFSPW